MRLVRAAVRKCPTEAAGWSGRAGARVYRGSAFLGLVHDFRNDRKEIFAKIAAR